MEKIEKRKWKGRTGGQKWMHDCLISWLRHFDVKSLYCVMALVIPFYMLINHSGYISIYHYFRRRMYYGRMKSFFQVYLNHYRFGQIILDRFAAYAGQKFKFEIENAEGFEKACNAERGILILSSHTGNYELAGYSIRAEKKKFYALGYFNENETIMDNKTAKLEENNIFIIPVKEDLSHIFAINDALEEGQIVSLPSDRIFGSSRYAGCRFLGKEAKFPLGPFMIALQRDVPVFDFFIMKESAHQYRAIISELSVPEDAGLTKREKADRLAAQYAENLEKVLRRYPEQWFNFYDFWEED